MRPLDALATRDRACQLLFHPRTSAVAERTKESGRGRACFRDGNPCPLPRHGRACPGHPRRTEPHRAPDGYGPTREPAAARAGVGAWDKPGHDCGGGRGDGGGVPGKPGHDCRGEAVEGGPAFATAIHTPYPVMAGLVPATHAAPSRTGLRTATAQPENPRRHGPAWVPGTSPGMTVEGVEESGRGRACFRDGDPYPLSRHGRACPGHPRRAEPHRAPDGYGPTREPAAARAGVGARDKPGHDCGGSAERSVRRRMRDPKKSLSFLQSWPGPARGPTPRRAAPGSG